MENAANQILLTGTPVTMPEFSHTNHDRKFYQMMLDVGRLSGATDRLPVLLSEELLRESDLFPGELFTVAGQIRSFNNKTSIGRKLIICVYATSVLPGGEDAQNAGVLQGTVCRAPVFRRTPLGREIADLMLAVPRAYHRSDYIPCILWGRSARQAGAFPVGTKLRLEGRLQSRQYIKVIDGESQTRTTYEFSVGNFEEV